MDPASAIGTTAAVLGFVNFATDLFVTTRKIYRGGSKRGDSDIEGITEKLKLLISGLDHSTSFPSGTRLDPQEQALTKLCGECTATANDLLILLQRLKPKEPRKSIWFSFKLAVLTLWTEKDVESMQNRLKAYREQVSMYIMVSIKCVSRDFLEQG